jgi:hypothetical protein
MEAVFLGILILAMGSGLSAAHVAFAEPNNVHKIVAARQPSKHRAQLQTFGKPARGPYMAAPKTIKPGLSGTEARKNSSGINGTTTHRKH